MLYSSKFGSYEEALLAFENKEVSVHAIVDARLNGNWIKETTLGRILYNQKLPSAMPYINKTMDKSRLTEIIGRCYKDAGNYQTVAFLDELKDLGFEFAFKSGLSIHCS